MGFGRFKHTLGSFSGAIAVLLGLAIFAGNSQHGNLALAQNYETDTASTAKVSVSTVIQEHLHSMAIRDEDIDPFMAIAGDTGSIPIESSGAFNNGKADGPTHLHVVQVRKNDLQNLKDGKDVEIASETSDGHSHIFRFVTKAECPGIYIPPTTYVPAPTCAPGSDCYCRKYPGSPSCGFYCPPGSYCYCQKYPSSQICGNNCPYGSPCYCQKYPKAKGCTGIYTPPPVYTPPPYTPRPSATPTPSATVSASPSPSPSPSLSPSPSPSATASPRPSPSPSATASPSPSPSVTATGGVTPSPSATPTQTITALPSPSSTPGAPGSEPGSEPEPTPTSTPTDPSCPPGSDCYCGIPGNSSESVCATNCSTPGTPCFCTFNSSDPSCPGNTGGFCAPGDLQCLCLLDPSLPECGGGSD